MGPGQGYTEQRDRLRGPLGLDVGLGLGLLGPTHPKKGLHRAFSGTRLTIRIPVWLPKNAMT